MAFKNLSFIFYRHFSTGTNLPKLPNFTKIPSRHRDKAIQEAQKALTDYLHGTRLLPYTYAENIGKNSIFSLSNFVGKLNFSPSSVSRSFRKFLRYHPINEFEFFFESIGIDYDEVSGYLPANKFFFSEDGSVLDVACALSEFGFPWNKLGKLYKEKNSIFSRMPEDLTTKLCRFKDCGFSNVSVVGICLAFPFVLSEEGEVVGETEALSAVLKSIFLDCDFGRCVEENVDSWYEVCRKIRVFYDLNCEKEKLGELMSRGKDILLQLEEEVLIQKMEYFCRFGVKKEEVAPLLLHNPELLTLDMETPRISVLKLLKHFGMTSAELQAVSRNYPHVLGTNKMANLPHVMRATDLHKWFFNNIKNGNHQLLASYIASVFDEDQDEEFKDGLERIHLSRTPIHTINKLNFMHGIGFGENALTMKVLDYLHGTSSELQERYDCLLHLGIKFSNLSRMVRLTPKILNQSPETLEQKVYFLCGEMGSSLEYLNQFPAFLCFDLENRIKPRFRFHMWLTEKGVRAKDYSIGSIIATSQKGFMARLFKIHPAAPKHWFESFYNRRFLVS